MRILRILRIIRIIRVGKFFEGFAKMIDIFGFSIPYLANVLLLFILILFIFSVLSSFLFKDVIKGNIIGKSFTF